MMNAIMNNDPQFEVEKVRSELAIVRDQLNHFRKEVSWYEWREKNLARRLENLKSSLLERSL